MELTDKGLEEFQTVFWIVSAFISFIKKEGVPQSYYNQMKKINHLEFRFQQKKDPWDLVSDLIPRVDKLPIEEILNDGVINDYDEKEMQKFISYLRNDNLIVFLSSADIKLDINRHDPYFDVDFDYRDIPKEWLKFELEPLSNPYYTQCQKPKPNRFIPEDFTLAPDILNGSLGEPFTYNQPEFSLGMIRAKDFRVPKVRIISKAYLNPIIFNTEAKSYICLKIWINYILNELSKLIDEFANVSLDFSVGEQFDKVKFSYSGYSDKIEDAMVASLVEILKLYPFDKEETFVISKEKAKEEFDNVLLQDPDEIAEIYAENMICQYHLNLEDLKKEVENFSLEDFKNLVPNLFKGVFLEIFIAGNMKPEEGILFSKKFSELFQKINGLEIANPKNLPRVDMIKFPKNSVRDIFVVELDTDMHTNSACFLGFQALDIPTPEGLDQSSASFNYSGALVHLINQYISNEAYNTLRTEEQLGYVCSTSVLNRGGHYHLALLIQSDKYECNYITSRIEDFIKNQKEKLKNLNEEDFLKIKDATLLSFVKKPMNLKQSALQYYSQQFLKRKLKNENSFRKENEEIFDKISKEEFIQAFDSIFVSDRRIFEVHVVSLDKKEISLEERKKRTNVRVFYDLKELKDGKELLENMYHLAKSPNLF